MGEHPRAVDARRRAKALLRRMTPSDPEVAAARRAELDAEMHRVAVRERRRRKREWLGNASTGT